MADKSGSLRAAWLGISLLLVAEAALAQFRPLRFDDDFSAQRQSCVSKTTAPHAGRIARSQIMCA